MSYVVLARKHRPQSFDDVIGQEHISDLLAKSIKSGRLAQAYLFCGPRGVGKTTCARILAMCLNCEGGPTTKLPKDSPICQEIAQGRSFDVMEVDGASNRGIDEIRTLRENVKFAPSSGQFKIYIVDEVHMLTTEAFNALLKTLEEPPEHVKFIFATTAPNKIPATIISRCQRFDFKRIPIKTIVSTLENVSKKEKVKIDQDALFAVAKASGGSLRDALSILDQLSALGDVGVKGSDVYSMLGLVETEYIFELTNAIGGKDCTKALEVLDKIIEQGKDIKQLLKDLIEHYRNLMVIKVGGKGLGKLIDHPIAIKQLFLDQSELFTLKEILGSIDTLIASQDSARITENIRMTIEVALAKLTYSSNMEGAAPVKAKLTAPKVSAMEVLKSNKGEAKISNEVIEPEEPAKEEESSVEEEPEVVQQVQEESNEEHAPGDINVNKLRLMWDSLTSAVSQEKMSTATYLQDGSPVEYADGHLTIGFSEQFVFHKETLEDKLHKDVVERIFTDKLGVEIFIKPKIVAEIKPRQEDDHVQEAIKGFEGKVTNRWHNDK